MLNPALKPSSTGSGVETSSPSIDSVFAPAFSGATALLYSESTLRALRRSRSCCFRSSVTHTIRPVDPHRLVWRTQWLVHQDAQEGRDYDVERLIKVWDATNREDIGLVEGAFREVQSRRFVPGPLAPTKEPAIRAALATYLRLMEES